MAAASQKAQQRVLLISSYSPGFPTFFEQINGVKSIFATHDILLDVEFMDTKRFADRDNERLFHQRLSYKLSKTLPYDLVMTADDAALLFLLKTKNDFFPKQPVVFFGVNNIATAQAQNKRRDITGVIEAVSMQETIAMMRRLQPEIKRILALVDATPSGQGDLATFFQSAPSFPALRFSALNLGESTFADFAEKLQQIDNETGVLLLSAYVDATGRRLDFSDSLHLILTNLHRPLYHLWYHGLGDGILGGKVISHFEQGKAAATMALRILNGTPPESIPVSVQSPNIEVIDYNILKKYNLPLKNLPQNVDFLNKPISFYDQHKHKVWLGALCVLLQSAIIMVLVVTLQKNKRTQAALVESEDRYASLFYNNQAIIYLIDPRTGIIEDINPAACRFYGYPHEQLLGQDISFLNTRPMADLQKPMEEALEGTSSVFQFQHRLANGQLREVEVHSGPVKVGGRQLLCSIVHDISDRIQAEQTARERELFLNAILQTTAEGFVVLDGTGTIIEVNEAYCTMIGYQKNELIGRHMSTIDVHDTTEHVAERSSRIIAQGSELFCTTHQRKDGSTIPLEISVTFLADNGGQFVSFCRDLSERQQAEKKLHRALQQTQIITSNLQLGLLLVNKEDQIEFVNQTFCDLMAIEESPAQLVGISGKEMLHKFSLAFADPEKEKLRVRELIGMNVLVQNDEIHLKNNRTLLRDLVPIVIDDIPYGRLWYLNDITQLREALNARKRLERQLIQSQKMEAIGTLAGGIAHDFNNILAAVIGYAEMAHNASESGSKIEQNLSMVLDAAQRATGLVQQILAFSRQGEAKPTMVEPARIVQEAVKLLRSTIPSTITIATQITPDKQFTLADPVQLQQVVLNLCTNAFHAMEKTGGTLTLSLERCVLGPGDLLSQPQLKPGPFIRLTVADTGPGVPPLLLDKIFEPYFTTKKVGRGTGMGLAIVHGIVTAIGGCITYAGAGGTGAVFHVYFPAVDGEKTETKPGVTTDLHGNGHILLVDDEHILVEMVQEMLKRLGYRVSCCTSPTQALELFHNNPEDFAAVITDQTMPEMTGSAMAQQMLKLRPQLPVILCTGYSNLIDADEAKKIGIQKFLMKPFSRKQLGSVLKEVLLQ
nr:PAS domain S-box protein [uncultured Desulfobulbus sp.]